MPVPPDLVPQLVVAAKDLLVVTTQEKRPDVTGAVLVGNPFNLVAAFRVPDSVSIWPDLCRIMRIPMIPYTQSDVFGRGRRRPRSGRRLGAYPVSSPPSRCLIDSLQALKLAVERVEMAR